MRTAIFSGTLALGLVAATWLEVFSQQAAPVLPGASAQSSAASGETQVLSTLLPSGVQQVVVVDARAQTMAVYHIEPLTGKIQLKSVRNLRLDLAMEEFNATTPLPSEMRLLKP
ncbi:MAG: hypothetical protein ACTHK7_22575 [Aureliella sp.]